MTVLIGGWGIGLSAVEHQAPGAIKIDGTEMAAALVDADGLVPNWQRVAADAIKKAHPDPIDLIVGWSTGAIIAWAAASILAPKKLLLLSPTPTFCRRDSFRAGMRPQILAAMREGLARNREETLAAFCANAGVSLLLASTASSATLCDGLRFLECADLRPLAPLHSAQVTVYCGTSDAIVPVEASRIFARETGAELIAADGGHGYVSSLSL